MDHNLLYCTRKVTRNTFNTVTIRSIKKTIIKNTIISNVLFEGRPVPSDDIGIVVDAWANFNSIFMGSFNNIAPIKQVRIK